MNISCCFNKNNSNKNWEKISKWIENEDICSLDLMAICCAKFADMPQVKSGELKENKTELLVDGNIYSVTIQKM